MVVLRYSGVKGKDGSNGQSGKSGDKGSNGGHGNNGSNGEEGKSSGTQKVVISAGPNNELIIDGQKYSEIIGTSNCFIEIYSEGGQGGSGGNGGNGGKGGNGIPGVDARQGMKGTNGQKGGDGGDGGNGGNGANGGNGGTVCISVSEKDTDLLYLLRHVSVAGGSGGSAGKRGFAGDYGYGGKGGRNFTGFDGVKNQQGGSDGPTGRRGKEGQEGVKGQDGQPGNYFFNVIEQNKNFGVLFNLVMGNIKQIQSPDLIVEPGEVFKTELILYNETPMSTPAGSPILVSLLEDPLIIQNVQENTLEYSLPIAGGQSVTLPKQFEFKIAPQLNPKINSTLNETYKLKFKAILKRVKAEFKGVQSYEQPIKIEYPVELTFVSAPRSFLEGEDVPIVIGIKNKSNKPLGIKNGRLLNMRLYNEGKPGAIQFTPYSPDDLKQIDTNNTDPNAKRALDQSNFIKANEDIKKFELIKQVFIPHINANETIFFKGSIKVVDPSIQAYDCASLRFCLDIGHIDDPANKYQTIQENLFKLQKSEQLTYKEKSDVLLVINSEVERDQIFKIRESFKVFGADCDIYSITQHKNFDYHFDPQNKSKTPLAKKATVIFGNPYNDHKNQKTNAIKQIGIDNIYKSSYIDDTRNYILGSSKFIPYGRIFNYPAIELYQGTSGHELKETFPYKQNFKIMIPDLAVTYADYYLKYKELNPSEDNQGVSYLDETQKQLVENKKDSKDNKKLPDEMLGFDGLGQECQRLFSGNVQQKMKNVLEITNYFKKNPTKIESIRNLDNGYRLRQGQNMNLDNTYDHNNIIINQIKTTHENLAKLDPTNQYHTRHQFLNIEDRSPNALEEYIGKAFQSSGNQNIVRGLRRDCAQIAFRDKGELVPVIDDGDIYNILKIIHVTKKIGYINTFTGQNETLAEILFSSIASDLCDEFKAYTSVSKRSEWKAPQYLSAMQGWKAINEFNFDTLVKNKNIFLLQKFLVMIQSVMQVVSDQVGFFVKVCCCSCFSVPSSIVLSVCQNVQKIITPKINACEGASDKISDLVSKKFQKANNSQLKFDLISRPDRLLSKGTTFYSNQSSCIVQAFDPVPAWIRQELQNLENKNQEPIKVEVNSSKKVYQSEQERRNDIDKYVQEIDKKQS